MQDIGQFRLVDVIPFGDPDSGESQRVTIGHSCDQIFDGLAETFFDRRLAGQHKVPFDCGHSTIVNKQGGEIFIAQTV